MALRRTGAAGLRSFALVAAVASGLLLAISLRYFFLAPTALTAVVFAGYAVSWLASGRG